MPLEPEVVSSPRQDQGRILYGVHDLLGREVDLAPDRRLPVGLDAGATGDIKRVEKRLLVHVIGVPSSLPRHQ
jgi:hypothetical protein